MKTCYRHILVNFDGLGGDSAFYSFTKDIDDAIKLFNNDTNNYTKFNGACAFTNEEFLVYDSAEFVWGHKIY